MKKYYSNYEKRYTIKELFRLLLTKAWFIVITMVIFMGLFVITEISNEDSNMSIELTDEEKIEADKYISYVKSYEEESKRLAESYAYNLNPHDVITSYSQYFVKCSNEKDSYDVVNALIEYLRSGGLARDTAKITNIAKPDEIFDLIVLDVNDTQQNKEQVTSVIGIKFYADNEEFCNQLNMAIQQAFQTYANSLDEVIAVNDLILLSNSNVKGYNQYYYNWQSSKKQQFERMDAETQALYNNLSAIQQAYVNNILEKSGDENLTSENKTVLKVAIIGAALGFLLSSGGLVLYYMFDSSVKTEKELQDNFDILHIGNLSVLKKGKWHTFVDMIIIRNKSDLQTEMMNLCNYIVSICTKESLDTIAFVLEEETIFKTCFQSLKVRMKEMGINLVCINDIYGELNKYENVILVVTKNKSNCQNIVNIVNMCTAKDIQIQGYVTVI